MHFYPRFNVNYSECAEEGGPIGICINCGDGICSESENICGCPEDCSNGGNSLYTVEGFF